MTNDYERIVRDSRAAADAARHERMQADQKVRDAQQVKYKAGVAVLHRFLLTEVENANRALSREAFEIQVSGPDDFVGQLGDPQVVLVVDKKGSGKRYPDGYFGSRKVSASAEIVSVYKSNLVPSTETAPVSEPEKVHALVGEVLAELINQGMGKTF